jgi:hypothetical protein
MRIKISRDSETPNMGSSLWEVISCQLFARRYKGKAAPHLDMLRLQVGVPALLYFRAKGCIACDLIDMQVVQNCQKQQVALRIIDRHPGLVEVVEQDLEADAPVLTIPDYDGVINRAYGVAVYPCFVFIGQDGCITLKEVGVRGQIEDFPRRLKQQLGILLA